MELKAGQLKQLMELTIKYFLLFFSERQSEVVEIFLAVFERTNDAIRYAMGD